MCHMSPNYLTYTKVILWKCEYSQAIPQGPHSQILMIGVGGGGGVQQRLIIYTQKYPNFRICLPKKITTFLTYPKISLSPFFATQKIPLFFSQPKKIPAYFIDPKKFTFGQNFRPQKITWTTQSLKYVSGVPGSHTICTCFVKSCKF